MIHRQNWIDTNAWLHHLESRAGLSYKTINKYRGYMRHLLEWADETPFPACRDKDPIFPVYIMRARNDNKKIPLSYTSIYKCLIACREFFTFASKRWTRYHALRSGWVDMLRPMPASKPQPQFDDHKFYKLDEIRALLSVPADTLRIQRAQAGAAILFLSGMRADTLASIPMQCIDINNMQISQLPERGARTKNNRAAITYLLDIPELLQRITQWDARLRAQKFAPQSLWYASITHDGASIYPQTNAGAERATLLRDDTRLLCQLAGVDYKSPHKFRHGHIVYARSRAQTIDQVKAISQNVMHSNTIITDQVYGALVGSDVREIITSLGAAPPPIGHDTREQIAAQIAILLEKLKHA